MADEPGWEGWDAGWMAEPWIRSQLALLDILEAGSAFRPPPREQINDVLKAMLGGYLSLLKVQIEFREQLLEQQRAGLESYRRWLEELLESRSRIG